MRPLNINDIRAFGPCYDPSKHIPEDWQGSVLDIAQMKQVSLADKLWLIMRTDLVSEKFMRLYAVWCARQVMHLNTDERVANAIEVAFRFACGEATGEERAAAESAAWSAAQSAAQSAQSAARLVAQSAAWSAAESAAQSAESAAWSAAQSAESEMQDRQAKKLIEFIEAGIHSGDVK